MWRITFLRWNRALSGIISNMEPCSIWDDVEVGPTNIRVTPLKHTHLDFGSARSNWLIQFDVKFICDQPIEGAIDVLSPEFSIWGRFYVQSVLGKHINYCLPISKEFCLKFKLSATVSMILDSHPPLRPSTVVYVNGVRLKLVALVKKKHLFQHFFGENWPQCTPSKVVQLFREETSKSGNLIFYEGENLCSSSLVPVHMSCGPLQNIVITVSMEILLWRRLHLHAKRFNLTICSSLISPPKGGLHRL